MHDRGETSLIRSVLTSSPAIITVSALTGALLVAVPAPSTGAAQGRSGAAVRSEPGPVSPEVRETQIPPVSGLTAARSGLAAQRTDDNGESRLAAHVRLSDVADFTMLGVTWAAGAGEDLTARVRTLSSTGWSPWTDLHVDHDEGPASGEESAARPGTAGDVAARARAGRGLATTAGDGAAVRWRRTSRIGGVGVGGIDLRRIGAVGKQFRRRLTAARGGVAPRSAGGVRGQGARAAPGGRL